MKKNNDVKFKVFDGFIWTFAERFGAQGVGFIVSLIIARLLEPSVYGVVALINVFIFILEVFIDSGLGTALVQKKDADDTDFSSVFYFNLVMSVALYFIMFFCAPPIAKFYNNSDLILLIRVISITLLVSGVKSIQFAFLTKHLLFKKMFFSTLGGTVFSAVIGIYLAYNNYGVWALIVQSLSNNLIDTIILWFTVKWRPKSKFSLQRLKVLLSYGWKLLISAILDRGYGKLRDLIIGKIYTTSDLAYYNNASYISSSAMHVINSSIDTVLLPVMSSVQDNKETVKTMTRRAITTSVFIIAPMLFGLSACAELLISLVLTDKWLPTIPYLRIFCFTYVFYPIHTANLSAIKAMGRSDLFLKLEIIKKVVGLIAIIVTMRISVMAMAISAIFVNILSQIINAWPNKKLLDYSYLEQLKDIIPYLMLSAFMFACVYPVRYLNLPDLVILFIQVSLGIVIYLGLSKLFKIEALEYVLSIIKPIAKSILNKQEQ
ncbi:MAG: lipopolysaccharide biosynthesis protein [Ruminococcaceae bacterium]|nr:lipopolysaccharide biosynthesis protein [Oscillospiraceae bacterium]